MSRLNYLNEISEKEMKYGDVFVPVYSGFNLMRKAETTIEMRDIIRKAPIMNEEKKKGNVGIMIADISNETRYIPITNETYNVITFANDTVYVSMSATIKGADDKFLYLVMPDGTMRKAYINTSYVFVPETE